LGILQVMLTSEPSLVAAAADLLREALQVQSNLFERDLLYRDFKLRGTLSFALFTLSPYKSKWLR
jgi:hypothetical protein